jgi:N-sulfoglucosamine sulfohydrolase
MVRVPGVTKAGAVDKRHMVSVLDLLPTVMDALGVEKPSRLDGRSFYPVLKGEKQADRDFIIKQYHENSGRSRDPMRAIQTKTHLYLFNPWSNGERIFATATNGTVTCKRMIELAKDDKAMNERLNLYRYRVPQELYQVKRDPDCLQNLIDSSNNQEVKNKLQKLLEEWMVKTGDPILECFRKREDPSFVEAYVQKLESESEARRKASAPKPKTKKKKKKKS